MSDKPLSIMDYKKADGMRYLRQPRGPGTAWVFKMPTPPPLIGLPNPWDGKPFGKEISRGLGTRHPVDARKRRDMALGDVRKLQYASGDSEAFSLTAAVAWRESIADAENNRERAAEGIELALTTKLEKAEARGIPLAQLKSFAKIATGKGFPFNHAHEQYLHARRVNNPAGYKPLKRTTIMSLETAITHLQNYLSDVRGTPWTTQRVLVSGY